ncbi:MAG: DUF2530 domain-containing protein [Tetrasphaera sp.]
MSTLRRDNGRPPVAPEPLRVRNSSIVLAGMAVWALALAVILLVPRLHAGERSWWPWACVTGLTLGAIGYVYVRRGRGNAAAARPADPQEHY